MNWYRQLASQFSELTEYDGWVIGRAELNCRNIGVIEKIDGRQELLRQRCTAARNVRILRRRSTMALLEAEDSIRSLRIQLIKRSGTQAEHAVVESKQTGSTVINRSDTAGRELDMQGDPLFSMCCSRDEIRAFTRDVKDYNSLHQNDQAIVPGLLIMERLLQWIAAQEYGAEMQRMAEWEQQESLRGSILKMRFFQPIEAGQLMQICGCGEKAGQRFLGIAEDTMIWEAVLE